MKISRMPPENIKELLDYNPETGVLTWKKQRSKIKAGDAAGCIASTGYVQISFNYKSYLAHRIIWYLFYNELPSFIDHINGVRSDNRIVNLRKSSSRENNSNRICHRNGKSVGVYQVRNKFRAYIFFKKRINLGYFKTKEEAENAYFEKRKEIENEIV